MTVRRERFVLLFVLLGGLAIRLPFIAIDPRVSGDLDIITGWAELMASGGLAELVSVSQAILYPPLAMLWIWLGGVLGSPLAIIKLAPIAADVALAWLIWLMLRERGRRVALAATAAVCFNPAFWYLSAIWGQIDSVFVLFMVASIALLAARRVGGSWAAWTLGVAWKVQAAAIAPVLLAATLREHGRRGLLVALAATAGVAVASYASFRIAVGGGLQVYAGRLWHDDEALVISGFNLWFLVRPVVSGLSDALYEVLSTGTAWAIGWAVVVGVASTVMHATWRRPSRDVLALGAAMLALAPFVLLIGMRERYLLATIPFLLLVGAGWGSARVDRAGVLAFVAITVSQLVNLLAVASPARDLWINAFATDEGALALPIRYSGYALALVNLGVLAWGLMKLYRRGDSAAGELVQATEEPLLDERDVPVAS